MFKLSFFNNHQKVFIRLLSLIVISGLGLVSHLDLVNAAVTGVILGTYKPAGNTTCYITAEVSAAPLDVNRTTIWASALESGQWNGWHNKGTYSGPNTRINIAARPIQKNSVIQYKFKVLPLGQDPNRDTTTPVFYTNYIDLGACRVVSW